MGKTILNKCGLRICIESLEGEITAVSFLDETQEFDDGETLLKHAKIQLSEYFDGKRKEFSLPYKYETSTFNNSVYREVARIPYGKTSTYGEVAVALGNKNKARAVGNALRSNKLLILIPCHRVVGKGKNIGGYSGGVQTKKMIIDFEKRIKNGH